MKSKEEFNYTEGVGWAHRRSTAAVLLRKDLHFLNDREIILMSNHKNEAAKAKKREFTFLDQLNNIDNYFGKLEK